jgi:hypothetical protein
MGCEEGSEGLVARTYLGGGLEVSSLEEKMSWIDAAEPKSPRHDGLIEFGVPRALQLGHVGSDDEVRCA